MGLVKDSNWQLIVLKAFLRAMFNTAVADQISMSYFASIMSNIVLQLRPIAALAKTFGGFLTDIKPLHQPRFAAIWFYLLPLVIPPLLADDDALAPTSQLIVAMLSVLSRFPADWGCCAAWRKCYKAILRTLLLIVHDSPRFVAGFYYDFLATIPVQFRRLRNVILCCKPGEPVAFMSHALKLSGPLYDRVLNSQYLTVDTIAQLFDDRRGKPFLAVAEVDLFLMHVFKVNVRADVDERAIGQHLVCQLVQLMLMWCKSVRAAATVVEGLLDQVRFDCLQSRFFVSLIMFIVALDMTWDGVALQDIVFAVVLARTQGLDLVPVGAKTLWQRLLQIEGFRAVVESHERNKGDD
jgi:hypothetical protein